MSPHHPRVRRAASLLTVLLVSGCRGGEPESLTVFAAASLADVFTQLSPRLEAGQGRKVRFNFAGSQQLRAQLEHGAGADVFASADEVQMQTLSDAGLVDEPVDFVCNALTLIVPRGNPAGVRGVEDLAATGRIVLAGPEVPAGAYTQRLLQRQGARFAADVASNVVSFELNVRHVVTKVQLGEANAGIVYVSDAVAAGAAVEQVRLDDRLNVVARYSIARVKASRAPAAADAFIRAVMDSGPQLERSGFVRCR